MKTIRKYKVIILSLIAIMLSGLAACDDAASVASRNLSKAANEFEITRRVVFFNGITDKYILEIIGRCSINDQGNQLEVTCKTGPNAFKKHFLGLSNNVSYFAQQMEAIDVSVFHYRVTFKPQVIIPDIDFKASLDEAIDN